MWGLSSFFPPLTSQNPPTVSMNHTFSNKKTAGEKDKSFVRNLINPMPAANVLTPNAFCAIQPSLS
jgi:hypothetical protein